MSKREKVTIGPGDVATLSVADLLGGKMTCNGPRRFVQDSRAALQARLDNVKLQIDAVAEANRFPLECKRDELTIALAAFQGRADDEYLGRAGCGADLSAQIAAIPEDGEVYEYQCPQCGNTGTVRKAAPPAAE